MELHPPFYEPDSDASSEDSESDPSMVTPNYSLEMDPSEPTSMFLFPFDSAAVSSTMGSCVIGRGYGRGFIRTCAVSRGQGCGRGCGCGDVSRGWGNNFVSS